LLPPEEKLKHDQHVALLKDATKERAAAVAVEKLVQTGREKMNVKNND